MSHKETIESNFTCGICANLVVDPVQMTCEGGHLFCFNCMFEYYRVRATSEINCPNCRHGNGSFFLTCGKIVKLLLMYNDVVPITDKIIGLEYFEPPAVQSSDYKRLLPVLSRRFPIIMEDAKGSAVITNVQMGLFARNYKVLLAVESGVSPSEKGRRWVNEEGHPMRRTSSNAIAAYPRVNFVRNGTPMTQDTLPEVVTTRLRSDAVTSAPVYQDTHFFPMNTTDVPYRHVEESLWHHDRHEPYPPSRLRQYFEHFQSDDDLTQRRDDLTQRRADDRQQRRALDLLRTNPL